MFPSNAELAWAKELTRFTPDISQLEEAEFRLFFFPDDFRRDCLSYPKVMEHSAFEAMAFTKDPFNFYVKNNGDSLLPIALEAKTPSNFVKNAPIFGELHSVRSSHIPMLDIHRQNGVQFIRKRVKITLPFRYLIRGNEDEDGRELPRVLQGKEHLLDPVLSSEKLAEIKPWMYVGNPDYWNPLLDGGYTFQQVKVRQPMKDKPWLKEYYDITK